MTELATLERDVWRISPDTFAEKASHEQWIRYPHLEYSARIIRKAIREKNGRLIFTMPPRHGKSELISHWLPVWFFDLWPDKNVLITSYGDKLARSFGRKVKRELAQNELVSTKLSQESKASTEFETEEGGELVTAGIGGGITGRGGHLIIIDDPIKTLKEAMSANMRQSQVEWFNNVLYTRREPEGTIIVVMTRWHEDDLGGYLLHKHTDDWTLINLPAVAEKNDPVGRKEGEALCADRFSIEDLEQIRLGIGTRMFSALYQGHPTEQEGVLWKRQHWKRWSELPDKFDELVQSWDTNIKEGGGSYIVGQIWARIGASRYLLDQIRGKWGFNKMVEMFRRFTAKWPQARRKLIENKANGPALQDVLKKEIQGILLVEPKGGKEVRAMAVEPQLEAGNVWIPKDEVMYPWVKEFIEEAAVFPHGENDDQVDTASQALIYMEGGRKIVYGAKDRKTKRPISAGGIMGR